MNGDGNGEVTRRILALWLSLFSVIFIAGGGWLVIGRMDDRERIAKLEVYIQIGVNAIEGIDEKLEKITDRLPAKQGNGQWQGQGQ